jgi:hypothetical protein
METAPMFVECHGRRSMRRNRQPGIVALCLLAAAHAVLSARPPQRPSGDLAQAASGFHELFLHDPCTGEYAPQPDTCLHERRHEKSFTFGGRRGTTYEVTLRVRGIFEPTIIEGGETPHADQAYFKVGGKVRTADWSHWHIDVSEPKQTYSLNHYPKVSHTIYQEDFQATIPVAGGATVVVRVIDGNDRQIDNAEPGRADRQRIIEGVVNTPRDGQMLRLDVVGVKAR